MLDVGAGAAIHLRTRHRDWLFDCGSEHDYERILRPYLHASGLNELTGLLLTHGDSLHIGGAAGLITDSAPAILVDNPAPDRSIVHHRLQIFFKERGLNAKQLTLWRQQWELLRRPSCHRTIHSRSLHVR